MSPSILKCGAPKVTFSEMAQPKILYHFRIPPEEWIAGGRSMTTTFRSYYVLPTFTNWMPGPSYNLLPNTSRTITFTFTEPYSGSRRGGERVGLPPAPLVVEIGYMKNGQHVVETFVFPRDQNHY